MQHFDSDVKVLGYGSPLVDILINVSDEFIKENVDGEKGGMELVDISVIDRILEKASTDKVMVPGGSSANTITTLSRLGVKTGFLGKIGDDEMGSFFSQYYSKIGGDPSSLKKHQNVRTGCCLSMVTPDSERTMRTYLGAANTIEAGDIDDNDFEGYTHLHIEGYTLQYISNATLKVLELAKNHSLKISIDMASFEVVKQFKNNLPDLFTKYVDMVFCNEDESMEYTGLKEPEKIFEVLGNICDVVALKLGKEGSIIKAGDHKVKVPARLAKAVDTTGAGDIWQAGFLYGYIASKQLSGKLLEKAGGFASLLGSEVVQVMGASIPEERWKYINEEIKKINN